MDCVKSPKRRIACKKNIKKSFISNYGKFMKNVI